MEMSFDTINPFIRYCHSFDITHGMPFINVMAYDYRLMYIEDGEGYINIDGTNYQAAKGCLLFWQPGVLYSLLPNKNSPFSIIGINFDFTCNHLDINYPIPPDSEEVFNKNNIVEYVNFVDLEQFNKPVYLKAMFMIENSLSEIANEYMTRKKLYAGKIRGIFISLLCEVARLSGSLADSTENKVDQIIQYIREHYGKPITNKDIGQQFNFHPIYINRLMVKYTGTSLHQYLINYRITVALGLLQTTDKTITEIAYEVGFRDINYFSKCFKKNVGLSPKNYIVAWRGDM